MTPRRSLATLAVVLLILLAGIALLYVTRTPISPTTAVSTPIPTVTATASANPTPTALATRTTVVYCGTVAANTLTTGQGSGPRSYELVVTSGPGGGGRFSVPEALPLPAIGTYICGQFEQGVPMNGLVALLRAGDAGYVAAPTTTPLPGGIITGRIAYGSDFIPPFTAYAISTTDSRVWFSSNYPGLGNPPRPTAPPGTRGDTYTITGVTPGTYWVVADRNDSLGPDPGFYSRASLCQRTTPSGPCPDINPIPAVTVVAGQTASDIDLISWGTQPQPSPTLPPRPTPR